jgi:hypothetical protein
MIGFSMLRDILQLQRGAEVPLTNQSQVGGFPVGCISFEVEKHIPFRI